MTGKHPSRLRFNFGFLLDADLGSSRLVEISYPTVRAVDVDLTPLIGSFTVTRISEGIYIKGHLQSATAVECVRCLGDANVDIDLEIDDLFYYPPATAPEGEHVVKESGYIDLSPLIRELSLLAIPIQPICSRDCKGLCSQCGQNLNEKTCACDRDAIDPRLAQLKELLDQTNE